MVKCPTSISALSLPPFIHHHRVQLVRTLFGLSRIHHHRCQNEKTYEFLIKRNLCECVNFEIFFPPSRWCDHISANWKIFSFFRHPANAVNATKLRKFLAGTAQFYCNHDGWRSLQGSRLFFSTGMRGLRKSHDMTNRNKISAMFGFSHLLSSFYPLSRRFTNFYWHSLALFWTFKHFYDI